jgi:predicted homoserine dehydrogenase-like protein
MHLEAPISCAAAYLQRTVTVAPLEAPAAETMAVAKRDLLAGETLDDLGGYTFYGLIERADTAQTLNALPAGLAPGAAVVAPVRKGQVIRWTDVALDEGSVLVALRREQDLL